MSRGIFYLAVLTGLLMVLAYNVGATNLLGTGGSVVANLGNVFSGRNQQGQFAAYPSNAPAQVSGS